MSTHMISRPLRYIPVKVDTVSARLNSKFGNMRMLGNSTRNQRKVLVVSNKADTNGGLKPKPGSTVTDPAVPENKPLAAELKEAEPIPVQEAAVNRGAVWDAVCYDDPLCGGDIEKVDHLSEWVEDLRMYPNPMEQMTTEHFVDPDDVVLHNVILNVNNPFKGSLFRRAGPRAQIVFEPDEVVAAVVTCGGLCPGLNTVIREVVASLWCNYGVRKIYGVKNGYRGFYSENMIDLNMEVVDGIQHKGGTMLGTSRGGSDINKMVDSIEARGINQLYVIGGDGTQRGAHAIYLEARRRGLKLAVAGIPKTIDNDVSIIDKSFGFDTSVEAAQRAISAAHTEATSTPNGIGLVKLMGRHAGWIAMHSSLAARDVDLCLIPEVDFYLKGKGSIMEHIINRLRTNKHCVIVVAEGAGQKFVSAVNKDTQDCSGNVQRDASGNKILADVGLWLASEIKMHLKEKNVDYTLKYIDPTYMVRAVPANASDNVYCTVLAQSAVHGAMAGLTGFTVGPVNGRHAWIPTTLVTEKSSQVNPAERMWGRLLASTGQPAFHHQPTHEDELAEESASPPTYSFSPKGRSFKK